MGTRPNPIDLRRVLEETPSVKAAAEHLGVSRPTIYRWIRESGVVDFHRRVRVPSQRDGESGGGRAA